MNLSKLMYGKRRPADARNRAATCVAFFSFKFAIRPTRLDSRFTARRLPRSTVHEPVSGRPRSPEGSTVLDDSREVFAPEALEAYDMRFA
jgi:hypothetical protein